MIKLSEPERLKFIAWLEDQISSVILPVITRSEGEIRRVACGVVVDLLRKAEAD